VPTIDLTIESVAFGGNGLGRQNGKVVFVPFAIDGENVAARIVREKKQFCDAEIVELRQTSPYRVEPACPYFRKCGGCAYQHIDYEHQLAIKWQQVRDVVRRIGKLREIPIRPIIASPAPYGYRNRITVHADKGVVGYFRRDSHRLIDIERCPIAQDEVNRELQQLRASQLRDGHYTLRADSGPRIFSQANDSLAPALLDLVTELIPDGQELLIDAYCGAGFFAKALLKKFQRILGIDWDRFAIEEAKKGATGAETYIAGDVDETLKTLVAGNLTVLSSQVPRCARGDAVTIIVDPPSTGLSPGTRKVILEVAPKTFIYVSCNPATLARDLGELSRYHIDSITPLDMFPQTAEIEAVAHLRRTDL